MTRDEAIKILKELAGYEKTMDLIRNYSVSVQDALYMAIKALEQESKTRWIPVSERLPEKYTYTLWCASSGYVRSDYFNGEFWEDAKKLGYEVIAWMPLPEPYKPEGDKHDKI